MRVLHGLTLTEASWETKGAEGMTEMESRELVQSITQEIKPIDHGEVHLVFKLRDHQVALIEKTKIVKEKPSDYHHYYNL
jgi:hypothetical protein